MKSELKLRAKIALKIFQPKIFSARHTISIVTTAVLVAALVKGGSAWYILALSFVVLNQAMLRTYDKWNSAGNPSDPEVIMGTYFGYRWRVFFFGFCLFYLSIIFFIFV